jgi:hypothetical protein
MATKKVSAILKSLNAEEMNVLKHMLLKQMLEEEPSIKDEEEDETVDEEEDETVEEDDEEDEASMSQEEIKEGHMARLVEKIKEYLEDYFEETGISEPNNINIFVQKQAKMVLEKMYTEDCGESHPSNVLPTVEGDYYKENIVQYGTAMKFRGKHLYKVVFV